MVVYQRSSRTVVPPDRQMMTCFRGMCSQCAAAMQIPRVSDSPSRTGGPRRAWSLVVMLLLLQFLGIYAQQGQGPGPGFVDNWDEFLDSSVVDDHVHFEVLEEQAVGTVVGVIPVKPGFTYRFSETPPEFELNGTSGVITTSKVLDRESLRNDRFDLVVLSSQPTYPIEVRIVVVDTNDNAPTFPEPGIGVSFSESANPGTRVILDTANDQDIGNNSVAKYKIVSGNDDAKFRLIVVTNPSGETSYLNLEIVAQLDREVRSFYQLNVSAQDGGKPPRFGYLLVNVSILDVNDNPPVFDQSDYVVSLNESVPPGTSVLQVHATDNDLGNNARIAYYLSEMETKFAVDSTSGVIVTQEILTCPQNCPPTGKCSKSCVFTVFAHDHGSPRQDGRTYITVNLLDANDNDPHISFRYNPPSAGYGTVDENAQNGTIVAAVSVVDPDEGPSGHTLVYIIAGNELQHFRIERNQDVDIVRVNSVLDREKINKYNLTIVAADKGSPPRSSTSFLIIVVNDINDHEPVFERSEYSAALSELVPVGSYVAGITATDADTGINSNVFYSIVSGNEHQWFSIDVISGLVTTSKLLDREIQAFVTLKISARDGGPNPRWAYTSLKVEILDENDESPYFNTSEINVTLSENLPANTLVADLDAKDGDEGANGTIIYVCSDETESLYKGVFVVDREAGRVITKLSLDREQQAFYTIKVIASDQGQPPRSSTATIQLSVQDLNDNEPTFYPLQYFVTMPESSAVGTSVVLVTAFDSDYGVNGEVKYTFVGDKNNIPFQINSGSGLISIASKLNWETRSHYRLMISASDGNDRKANENAVIDIAVSKKTHTTHLEFSQPSGYSFQIIEDISTRDATINRDVGKVSAFSQGNKGSVKYAIISGNRYKVFQINENTGAITTAKLVDREVATNYSLTVLARLESTYGKTTVNVTVSDINDNPPQFPRPHITTKVKENWPVGYEVYLARAYDPDVGKNSEIFYNLTVNPGSTFSIGNTTGMIYLKKVVSYEKTKEYNLEVQAVDSGNPPLMSRMSMKIIVEDVNDHTPLFEHLMYETSLSELTPVNNRFHALTASDGDAGANGRVSYRIVEGGSKFSVFPDGFLYVRSALDRETQNYYELAVVAEDHGDEPRSSSATVVIHILDENDNSPVFVNSTFNFTLHENELQDTYVGRLYASDKDIGRNAELTYSISTNQNDFVIDPKSGYIKSIRSFDREKLVQLSGQNYFVMEAIVSDNGIVRRRDEAKVNIFINDVNDNAPQFVRQPYKASISEGAPLHTQVVRVSATDADEGINGHVLYSIIDGNLDKQFKMDEKTGQITLIKSLDREKLSRYSLTVIAHDAGQIPLSSTATVTIDVLDENDSAPEFIKPESRMSILEDALVGTEIGQFSAHDNDLGVNGEVSFSIGGGNLQETFRIDTNTGVVFLEKPLDYETQPIYYLNITASDGGSPRLTSTTSFNVLVLDVNDNAPNLAKTPATRKIREGIPVNTAIMNVTAEDPDSGINGKVTFSISNQDPSGNHFGIRANTGIVYTAKQIDREYSSTFKLTIVATDQALIEENRLSSEKVVTIYVEDVNDNAPVFVSMSSAVVPENVEKGYVVMTLSATDADANENSQVVYELTRGDQDIFSVDRNSGNLYLNRRLDPNNVIYNLSVRVVDGATPPRRKFTESQVTVIHLSGSTTGITFSQPSYSSSVAENETIGTSVLTILATNPQNHVSDIQFFITAISSIGVPQHKVFEVDHKSGVVTTAAMLDRDQGIVEYELDILAVDKATLPANTATTKVRITVLDKNDSPPSFQSLSPYYSVPEDSPIGHRISLIAATDPDTTGTVSYSLLEGSGDGRFALDATTGALTLSAPLDREKKARYKLMVKASDGVQSAVTSVVVRVLDVNDNAPLFSRPVYSFDVAEDAPRGARVGSVKAKDADANANAQVSYTVISDWGQDVFSLNPDTGVFTLTSRLDYEQVQYYMFVVQAQDSGNPTLASSVTVYFNVLDLNDNAPLFDPMSYSDEVYENVSVSTSILTVTATDQDEGENGRIVYSIEGGNERGHFSISSNGTLITAQPLDRELQSFYNLVVRASDQASPPAQRLSSTVQVNIILRDVNDNAPQFISPNVTSVVENTATNTVVMAVKAVDRDEGRNSYVEYSLAQPDAAKFVLGPVDGLLRVNGLLDREERSNYSLRVVAKDRGLPPLSSTAEILVTVADENDNSPQFDPTHYAASVAENASVGLSVVQVSATDRDQSAGGRNGGSSNSLRYSIVAGDKNHDFMIGEDTGVIRIAKDLDYEAKAAYVLTVQAEDGGSGSSSDARHDTATVTVRVSDINDNPPVFVDSPYAVNVMENLPSGPSLAVLTTVTARDFDTQPNNQVRYFIKDGDHGLFQINGTTGEITVSRVLDREKEPHYELTVIAMDSGSPRLTGTGTIRVMVQDVNDNNPKFESTNYAASVMENLPPNTPVIQVTATDADDGLNQLLSYSLEKDEYGKFVIDPTSGQVSTQVQLDHEERAQYELLVVASDSSPTFPRRAVTKLTITVGDENDNAPRFEKEAYVAYIPDPISEGQFVFGATAMDSDSGTNGRVTYQLKGSGAENFIINTDTGVVRAAKRISKRDSVFALEMVATDGGQPMLSSTAAFEIRLRPHKNFPSIRASKTNFVLPELTTDHVLTSISATSPKSGPAGVISYHIAGGNIGEVFAIDSRSGELRVKRGLDYETTLHYELWVEARDADNPPMSIVLPLSINVTDVNDNTPVFEKQIYNASIMEEEYPPQPVVMVKAMDADSGKNGQFMYQLRTDENPDSTFSIDAHTGQISTNTRLDREEMGLYTLTVEAVDKGTPSNTGSATVIITLLDKNDNPPRFTRLFSANVTENSDIGTFVIQVTSSDKDIGSNANAVYSFTENPGMKFRIDPVSGNVTVAGPIDRELADEYILKVSAVDGAWRAETPLTITIQDVNDNSPEFQQPAYVFSFPELQRAITFVGRVAAADRDKPGPNAYISYTLKQPSDFFEIDPSTGDILSKRSLRYKHGLKGPSPENQFHLTVVATDHGKPPMSSESIVLINVIDANNNAPVFTREQYFSPVPASASIGLQVIQVEAVDDEDFGINAQVEYRKEGGNGSDFFDVDKKTGWITVASSLNSSKGQWFVVMLQATDRGVPPQTAEVPARLVVTGENKYKPVFSSPSYQVIIPENEALDSQILVVTATDDDIGVNGRILYNITSGNEENKFAINNLTGVISIHEFLDYESTQEYRLNITAEDMGFKKKSSVAILTIVVTDVNDNAPVFNQSSYETEIMENYPASVSIFKVFAVDVDSGRNAAIQYSITGGDGKDLFGIDLQTGVITTKVSFDYEEKNRYVLEVLASNPDSVRYTATTVVVHILSQNEVFPKFVQPVFQFTVSESASMGTSVGTVVATDQDSGPDGEIFYLLLGKNNEKGFVINSRTGTLYVSHSAQRESRSRIVLSVIAKNRGPIRGNDTDEAQVILVIQDGNDPPVFVHPMYEVNVLEDIAIGHRVIAVSASDRDESPNNRHFTYSIKSGNVGKTFRIDPQSGVIMTTNTLDRETVPVYNLTVGATDAGSPPQTGTAMVKVHVGDVNDNGPWIGDSSLVGSVPENEPPGVVVMVLNASDPDSASAGAPFTYVVVGGANADSFSVDKKTGIVKTKKTLDRELTPNMSFLVDVLDSGKPQMKSSYTVRVNVEDENDSPSRSRNATIVVFAIQGVAYTTRIADIHPLDSDIVNDFRCELVDAKEPVLFWIPQKCDLHTATIKNSSSHHLMVTGGDGKHPAVMSAFQIHFFTFSNKSINQLVNIRIENATAEEFVLMYYQNCLNTLKEIVETTRDITVGIFGIATAKQHLNVFVAAYRNQEDFLPRKEILNIFLNNKQKLKHALQPKEIIINYRPCHDKPCINDGQCDDAIVMHDTLSSIDTPNFMLTMPTVKHEFSCKCHHGFQGPRCSLRLNPCTPSPCQQGGTCIRQGQEYRCLCTLNRQGRNCEEERVSICLQRPCLNGGTCQEASDATAYCICRSGFRGTLCEVVADSCRPNPCENGGTCTSLKPGYNCSCRESYFGSRCERSTYGFGEMSYMAFPPLNPTTNDISIVFSTFKRSGLLFYSYGTQISGRSDFIAVEMMSGRVKFSAGTTRTMMSTVIVGRMIEFGRWYKVTASRIGKVMSLVVAACNDNGEICQECQPGNSDCSSEDTGQSETLNFNNELLYVGGVRAAEAIVDRPGQVTSDDFVGCVQSVLVNGRPLDLSRPIASMGITSTCPRPKVACESGACGGDNICVNQTYKHTCICSNGLYAPDCSEALQSFSLTEGTYVEFDIMELHRRHQLLPHFYHHHVPPRKRHALPVAVQKSVSLQFRTSNLNGILFYSATREDFTLIQIKDGYILYTSRSQFQPEMNVTLSASYVSDGEWYNVSLVRRGNVLYVSVKDSASEVNVSRVHDFLDPYLTKLSIGGTGEELLATNEAVTGFQGCISTFVVNGEVQPLNGSGSVFRAVVHGKLRSGCVGNVQSQGVAATDPLSVGVTLVIIFFVVLMVAIMVSFIVYRRRRLHREKLGGSSSGGSHHTKQNGTALLATSLNDGSRGHPESAYENGEVITDDVLRSHLVAHDLTAKKHKDRDFTDIPQRPDIIEREVINKSPGMPSLRMEDNSMLNDRNVSTLGDIQDSEAPEHYDLENASSIAPSDIDIVYHYKGYRDGNVRKYKTNPHIPNFHKHNHRHSPHQYHPTSGPVPLGTRNSPHNMLRQSPTALQPRDSPSMLKMQSTPLARLSPSSELSQQTPRILTLQDISGRPLQSALLATSQAAGVKDPMTNSERSLNSPVSQLSHSTSSMQSRNPSGCNIKDKKDRVNGVGVGLTAEEIDRLNSRPRNSSLVSTLDAVSSSSEDHCATKNKLAELLETNTELLEAQDSSTDESGNDSFTCSEFEYENNYDRVAREFGPGNMIFSKLAEVENENDEDSAKNFDGFDSFHGSLSTLVASDDDISNMSSYKPPNGSHLGWDYLLNWGPNFESLVGVFKDIAELPDSTNSKTNPKPGEEYV